MYQTDLSDKQWHLIKHLFEQQKKFGRPLKHNRRNIVNAILYITKSGCQWRMAPKDFPPFGTVYDYYRQWCQNGIWEKTLDFLNKKDRLRSGRNADPSYGIIDSQSTKTQYNSQERGIDGGKKNQRSQKTYCY